MTEIRSVSVERYEIAIPDPDFPGDSKWAERISAQRAPEILDPEEGFNVAGGYWVVCGDNTGSQALVVHDYMVEPLIELLKSLPTTVPVTEEKTDD